VRSLREWQEELSTAILGDGASTPSPFRMSHGPGLEVYRHAYRARLAGALRVNYPALSETVGRHAFLRIADDYARDHPSRSFSIRWHGAKLWRAFGDGPLGDLARMEWALGCAFDAADATPVDAQALSEIPVADWEFVPFAFHPSLQVLAMSWAVEAHWETIRGGDLEDVAAPRRKHALLVWRKDLQAHWRTASVAEAAALRRLGRVGTVRRTCEGLDESGAAELGGWLAGWIGEGMLVRGEEVGR